MILVQPCTLLGMMLPSRCTTDALSSGAKALLLPCSGRLSMKAKRRNFSTAHHCALINTLESNFDWSDRIGCQDSLSLTERGWHVAVDWQPTPFGAGLFSKQDIPRGTRIRRGIFGVNLKQFTSISDIDKFCKQGPVNERDRREYVKDYLWGFTLSKYSDADGYPLDTNADVEDATGTRRIYAMWIPGNGLNHNPQPNTVYVESSDGIDLVALSDITSGSELYDDYRRHGTAPEWLKKFAKIHNVSLNFADCNDFVGQ